MRDHNWHGSWGRPNDNCFEEHSGSPRHHYTSYQDHEPYERWRPGRGDRDWNDPPGHNARHDLGHGDLDASVPHNASMQPHESGFLGWDASAWGEAGGFEAVLFGHLSNSLGHAGGSSPIIVFAIEDLDVNFNIMNQITQVQNTLVLLNALNGGTIDVGGDVNAIGLQSAEIMNIQGFS